MAGEIRKRSVIIAGHATSVSVEEEFWEALKQIAARRGLSLNALIAEIDHSRTGNLSSAVRVFVLRALSGDRREDPAPAP
ncbi:MAG: ribbon-helix-helix domain-containing protein [Rhodospirillales bacterium]|nr:ribbon-helix-helix domain-containing protein [Rhodospirillales bacterium]